MKQSRVHALDFVRVSRPEKRLIWITVLLLVAAAWLPQAHAQALDDMAFGIRVEVPLFSAGDAAADGIKSFVGVTPQRTFAGASVWDPAAAAQRLAPPAMLGVQLTGRGSVQDVWSSNLARKKKIFVLVAATSIGIVTYWLTSDESSGNKVVVTLATSSLAFLSFLAADEDE